MTINCPFCGHEMVHVTKDRPTEMWGCENIECTAVVFRNQQNLPKPNPLTHVGDIQLAKGTQ